MAGGKNSGIELCRIVSMIFIILCHIVSKYTFIPGYQILGQFFNCAVFTFIAISGYIYGNKKVERFSLWIRKRGQTVVLPLLILTAIVVLLRLLMGEKSSLFDVVTYLLNMQGLGFIFPGFYRIFTEIPGLGPLWFTTVIMLCYCLVPALQRLRDRTNLNISFGKLMFWSVILGVVSLFSAAYMNIVLIYFAVFGIGYLAGAGSVDREIRIQHICIMTGIMSVFQVCRLILRGFCDGTITYQIFTSISQAVLGVWILAFFLWLGHAQPKVTEKMAGWSLTAFLSKMSFYIYMTHCLFCRGTFDVYQMCNHWVTATILFSVCSVLSAVILMKLTFFCTAQWEMRKKS